jgi:arylsulfatase A-like enzyme
VNVVVICIDTLRYDHLGCNGNDWIKTPNLDAFAREAVVFDNAYLASFPTIPHRTDVFTGRFGEPLHPWLPLAYSAVTLPALMGQAGWATQLTFDCPHLINGGHNFDYPFHGWHFERGNEVDKHITDDAGPDRLDTWARHYSPRMQRFTYPQYIRNNRHRYLEEHWPAPRTFKAAGDFVEMNRRRDQWFLWIDSFDPHEPWDPPDHYVALYDDPDYDSGCQMMGWEPLEVLDERALRHVQAHYAGEVTMVDTHAGRFLGRLAATGRDKDTMVIITCDHGTNLGAHGLISKGGPVYEQVGHQVLMVRLPGAEPGRRRAIVQPPDLMPTILELNALAIPDGCQGRSFAHLVTGEDQSFREVAISGGAIDVVRQNEAYLTVQDARWCLVDHTDPSKRELYDKSVDLAEEHNVIAQHRAVAERLHHHLLEFLGGHGSHLALVRWFEAGEKGDTAGFRFSDPYLDHYQTYFTLALDEPLHG